MKKTAAQIHNELVDRVMSEKDEIDRAQEAGVIISNYQIGWYDSLLHGTKGVQRIQLVMNKSMPRHWPVKNS